MKQNNNLTTAEKKEMYNKIMENISQQVIKSLNESEHLNEAYSSNKIKEFLRLAKENAKKYKNPDDYLIYICEKPEQFTTKELNNSIINFNGGYFNNDDKITINDNGRFQESINLKYIGSLTDSDFVGDIQNEYDPNYIENINKELRKISVDKQLELHKSSKSFEEIMDLMKQHDENNHNKEIEAMIICGPRSAFKHVKNYRYLKILHPEKIDYVLYINFNGGRKLSDAFYKTGKRQVNKENKNISKNARVRQDLQKQLDIFKRWYKDGDLPTILKLTKELSNAIVNSFGSNNEYSQYTFLIYLMEFLTNFKRDRELSKKLLNKK